MLGSRLRLVFSLLLLVLPLAAQEHKELGRMWTLENAPLDWFEKEYGFRPDQAWLDNVRSSALRYGNGCSASFVSPRGLIMTNHHCARDHIAAVSPEGQDWLGDGWFAQALKDEPRVPNLTVQQLVRTEDVTEAMNDGVDGLATDAEKRERLKANGERLMEAAAAAYPGLKPQLVTLYQGGQYQIYYHKIWDDIRLVAAPQLQMGKFGGDPDNFTFPRWSLDFTFVRAWENGAPADTSKHYFRWRTEGPQEGELTFVLGNPGSTGRLNTIAQMEFMRDAMYPMNIDRVKTNIANLERQAAADEAQALKLRPQILQLENARKAFTGYLDGLRNEDVMAIKRQAEAEVKAALARNPELASRYLSAFQELEAISAERADLLKRIVFYSGLQGPLFEAARELAAATDPSSEAEKRDSAAAKVKGLELTPSDEDVQKLERSLQRGLDIFGKSDPVVAALLGDGTPAEAARRLYAESELLSKEARERLAQGGREALMGSKDPAVRVAPLLYVPDRQALVQRFEALGTAEAIPAKRVGEAYFAVYGTNIPPDATFTLRISDGRVQGFPMNGTIAPFFTSLFGLYARNVEFGDKDPFHLPQNWKDKMGELDLRTPFCLVSTNDIIGGNSGSAMIDREARVVGLIFDGNIESLANRFVFTDEVARSVSVHPAIIIESLRKVYGAAALADELEAKGPGYQ